APGATRKSENIRVVMSRVMKDTSKDQLKLVIESQHGGKATFAQSVRVQNAPQDKRLWDGVVHIFNLTDNSEAKKAYAWSAPIMGSNKHRYFAVLHKGRITGPLEAVRAAVAAVRKFGTKKA